MRGMGFVEKKRAHQQEQDAADYGIDDRGLAQTPIVRLHQSEHPQEPDEEPRGLAEQQYGHSYIFLVRQAAGLFIGLLGVFALMETDYRRLREPAVIYPVVCGVLLLLVGTFFLDKSHATHRWIRFGPVGIQPSELAKLATILYLAWFLDQKRRNKASLEFRKEDFWRTIFPAAGPVFVYVALIFLQPDLGTSIDILVVATALFVVAWPSLLWLR